ncbi:Uncharacterised protein [Mycobacteroides abscessus subsp. abscessus]|nr:Uncharacterised protein [Mycobacteroides abscessus subsp. abscessus]
MNPNIRLSQGEKVLGTEYTILDFWQWGFSNLLTNNLRGIFAEFLVASALGTLNQSRIEWDAYDLFYKDKKIEVKSSAYIQAWYSGKPSKISFSIGHKKEFDYETNKYSPDAKRNADIYVFCLLKEKDSTIINPQDTSQWEFYIVPTTKLNDTFPQQKSLTLSSLQKVGEPILYSDIKKVIGGFCS